MNLLSFHFKLAWKEAYILFIKIYSKSTQKLENGILSKSYFLCFLKRHFITMCYNAYYAFHALDSVVPGKKKWPFAHYKSFVISRKKDCALQLILMNTLLWYSQCEGQISGRKCYLEFQAHIFSFCLCLCLSFSHTHSLSLLYTANIDQLLLYSVNFSSVNPHWCCWQLAY